METNAHGQPADPPLALRRPTVSAVICTVDRPVLLRQAIRSIREQRYDGVIETVVVFDGTAPDQSLKMCIRDSDYLNDISARTAHNSKLQLVIAFNYGGRAEIIDAVRTLMVDAVDPQTMTCLLYTSRCV